MHRAVVALLLLVAGCDKSTLQTDTDLGTLDVDTTDVDTDTDTELDTEIPTDVARAQPTAGGSVRVSSETYDLSVTVGAPVHSTVVASENYRLTVGVVAPNP